MSWEEEEDFDDASFLDAVDALVEKHRVSRLELGQSLRAVI